MVRRGLCAGVVAAVVWWGGAAGASVEGAEAFIRHLGDRAIQVLQSPDLTLEEREARFRELLRAGFDLPLIGRFVLGKYWRAATPAQQSDYLALFGEFLVQTYSQRFGGYAGETMTVVGARQANDKDVVVSTRIDRPSGPPIKADWRVRGSGGEPRIIDVMVEGISMAVTHRQEFAAVVQRDGIEGLLAVLRAKTTKLPATAMN